MHETSDRPLSFSLIIPTKNEALDIAGTLEACLAIDYPHKEVIVVDDSSDDTDLPPVLVPVPTRL